MQAFLCFPWTDPLHPGLRNKRSAEEEEEEETMTLAKFGQALSTLLTDTDDYVAQYVKHKVPKMCDHTIQW